MNSPLDNASLWICKKLDEVPISVASRNLPWWYMSVFPRESGDMAETCGSRSRSFASCRVRAVSVSNISPGQPPFSFLPGRTTSKSLPSWLNSLDIYSLAPSPNAVSKMTAVTPMAAEKITSALRNKLKVRACQTKITCPWVFMVRFACIVHSPKNRERIFIQGFGRC